MKGRRLLQSKMHNWFIQEAFDSNNKNARGKKHSFDKSNLKAAGRKVRYDKSYKSEII